MPDTASAPIDPSKNFVGWSVTGPIYRTYDSTGLLLTEKLPPGTYMVHSTPIGYHLTKAEDHSLPPKVYGDAIDTCEYYWAGYIRRLAQNKSTGVLLSGLKGSGKTLLAIALCKKAIENGLPVIVVTNSFCDISFFELLASVGPCVVLLDEFEKVYASKGEQNAMLGLFSGTFKTKALFVVTCNETHTLADALNNRPDRLYYGRTYRGLDQKTVDHYLNDRGVTPENQLEIKVELGWFHEPNFDMLQAIVNEHLDTGLSPSKVVDMLNLTAYGRNNQEIQYKAYAEVRYGGVVYKAPTSTTIKGTPLQVGSGHVYLNATPEAWAKANPDKAMTKILAKKLAAEFETYYWHRDKMAGFSAKDNSFTFGEFPANVAENGIRVKFKQALLSMWTYTSTGAYQKVEPLDTDADELALDD